MKKKVVPFIMDEARRYICPRCNGRGTIVLMFGELTYVLPCPKCKGDVKTNALVS